MDTTETTVRNFIVSNFLFGDESTPIARGDSLLESGIVDSMGVLELIAFLEQTFHIKIENHELVPDNLDSIANVTAYLQKKLRLG
ncbi:MAG: acyl carrier protein [Betaproteobacteria bacterium]